MNASLPPATSFRWQRWEGTRFNPLNLAITLTSGQSFRWRQDASGIWWGAVGDTVLALWQQESAPRTPLYWQTFPQFDDWQTVQGYLRLDVNLDALTAEWIARDARIADPVQRFTGLRILLQPPEECLFAFLCATAKPVSQIEKLVWELAARYGSPFSSTDFSPLAPSLYRFPSLEALAQAQESDLRQMGWGFRAPRVIHNARTLLDDHFPEWLLSLRSASYTEAKAELMTLFGIGPKVADCICLFSLHKEEAVPVDRHIQRIACQMYLPEMSERSLTPAVYMAMADAYRHCFGSYVGWAQQYLFFGQLRRSEALEG